MNLKSWFFNDNNLKEEKEIYLEGIYGSYKITTKDRIEVNRYRLSVLFCGLSFCLGLIHWLYLGESLASIWLFSMALSLGFALNWIHIYIRFIHNILKVSWGIGCLGVIIMASYVGFDNILMNLRVQPYWLFLIGPIFIALTGLGFKEFFCFRRAEALGLTILLPIALLGHITNLLNESTIISLISISAALLLLMSIRKFGIDAALDIGDKSIFEYLERQRESKSA